MKKLVIILYLFILSHSLTAQWKFIPRTKYANIPGTNYSSLFNIEVSGNYMFLSSSNSLTYWDPDSTFVRMDLTNNSKKLMIRPSGTQFKNGGSSKPTILNQHIFYRSNDTGYVSHDYGTTWINIGLNPYTFMDFYAKNNVVVSTAPYQINKSFDFGYSFQSIRSSYQNVTPLIIVDSTLYFSYSYSYSDHLGKVNLYTNAFSHVSNGTHYCIVNFNDTLISGYSYGIYRSVDKGNSWTEINNYYRFGVLGKITTDENLLYAPAGSNGVLVSNDQGATLFPFNEGLPYNAIASQLIFDSKFAYVLTQFGVYRRPKSEFIIRNVSGYVYYDINKNGVKDLGERGFSGQILKLNYHNNYYYTDSTGYYSFRFVGSDDSIKYIPKEPYFISNPSTKFIDENIRKVNFAVQVDTNIQNIDVVITPITHSRPGRKTVFAVDCNNYGGGHQTSMITIQLDSLLSLATVSSINANISNNVVTWNTNLAPFKKDNLTISCLLPPDPNLSGRKLVLTAKAEPLLADYNPVDNFDTLNQVITNSYDPNDKRVIPAGDIFQDFMSNEKYLQYFVRFQNTGTDTAFNVKIEDFLSKNLDLGTFKFQGSSHPCTYKIDTNRVVSFYFDNILLPDSTIDEIKSHGYLRYKIKPLRTLTLGERINSTSFIYFDFNSSVSTNTVVTYYNNIRISMVNEFLYSQKERDQIIFPNPTENYLFVKIVEGDLVELINAIGEKMNISYNIDAGLARLEMGQLPKGIYFVRVFNEDFSKTTKVMKDDK